MTIKGNYAEWFARYNWELFVTTRYPPSIHVDQAHRQLVADVLRPIAKTTKDTIGAITILMPPNPDQPQLHSHSLILSKNRTLTDNIDRLRFELFSTKSVIMSHDRAVDIIPYRSHDQPDPTQTSPDKVMPGHPNYMEKNIASSSNYQLFYYGLKLLKEMQP